MDEVIKKKIIQERNRNKELQNQLKNLETKVTEKLKPVVQLTQKIAEENRKTLKPLVDDLEKNQEILLKLNPFAQFVADKGGLLGTGRSKKRGTFGQSLLNQNYNSGIASLLDRPNRRMKPVLASRSPSVLQVGLNSYMKKHGLKNPVDFAKAYKKHKDYKIYGYINLRMILEEMNVSPTEALLYVCEGMTKSDKRWSMHRFEKEYFRGSNSLIYMYNYFKEKQDEHKKANKPKYSVKEFWKSSYVKSVFKGYGMGVPKDYSTFAKWWKRMSHHVEVLDKKRISKVVTS